MQAGTAHPTPRHGEASWAPKLTSRHVKVDPAQPAETVRGLINGASPAPGAWGMLETAETNPTRLKMGRARPADDAVGHNKQHGELSVEPTRGVVICQARDR